MPTGGSAARPPLCSNLRNAVCTNACVHREAKLVKSGKSRLNVDDKKIETLEEGQTIKLSLATGSSGGRTKRSTRLGGGLKKPSGLRKPTTQAAPSNTGDDEDLLGGLSSSMASTSISSAPAPAPAAAAPADDWEPF